MKHDKCQIKIINSAVAVVVVTLLSLPRIMMITTDMHMRSPQESRSNKFFKPDTQILAACSCKERETLLEGKGNLRNLWRCHTTKLKSFVICYRAHLSNRGEMINEWCRTLLCLWKASIPSFSLNFSPFKFFLQNTFTLHYGKYLLISNMILNINYTTAYNATCFLDGRFLSVFSFILKLIVGLYRNLDFNLIFVPSFLYFFLWLLIMPPRFTSQNMEIILVLSNHFYLFRGLFLTKTSEILFPDSSFMSLM